MGSQHNLFNAATEGVLDWLKYCSRRYSISGGWGRAVSRAGLVQGRRDCRTDLKTCPETSERVLTEWWVGGETWALRLHRVHARSAIKHGIPVARKFCQLHEKLCALYDVPSIPPSPSFNWCVVIYTKVGVILLRARLSLSQVYVPWQLYCECGRNRHRLC